MGPSVQLHEKYRFSSIIRARCEWLVPKMFNESNLGKLRANQSVGRNRTESASLKDCTFSNCAWNVLLAPSVPQFSILEESEKSQRRYRRSPARLPVSACERNAAAIHPLFYELIPA